MAQETRNQSKAGTAGSPAAQRQLKEARAEAEQEFGTGDLAALRKLYADRERENEQAVDRFVRELDEREAALAKAEAALSA